MALKLLHPQSDLETRPAVDVAVHDVVQDHWFGFWRSNLTVAQSNCNAACFNRFPICEGKEECLPCHQWLHSFMNDKQLTSNFRNPPHTHAFTLDFYAPAWQVRFCHVVIGSSVCLSVHPSVIPSRLQSVIFNVEWWYSNQTYTVSSSKGSSHFTDITPSGVWGGGVKMWDFCHILTLLPPGAPVFPKHMSSFERLCFSFVYSKYKVDKYFI